MASGKQAQNNNDRRVQVDIVIVGGGPATLGLLTNAVKSNRLNELVAKGEGLAIIEQGLNFGGGCLQNFGLNSNTSANGFIKCLYKRREIANIAQAQQAVNNLNTQGGNAGKVTQAAGSPNPRRFLKAGTGVSAAQANQQENLSAASPVRQKLKDMTNQGLDEGDSDDDDAQDEEDVYQPKKYEYVALNPFKDLYKHSPLIQMSFEFGPSCIPLSTVGMIMNYTGNHLLHYIHAILGKRVFFPMHWVVSVQLMQNGDIITTAMRKEVSIVLNKPASSLTSAGASTDATTESAAAASMPMPEAGESDAPFTIVNHGEVQVSFRSKAIVLSNGGMQNLHPDFYDWFPFLSSRKQDVLMSDYVLQKQGYIETIKRIKEMNRKRIVIIGGSHSGFSTAWLLANGPADILHNTHVTPTVQYVKKNTGKFEFPGAAFRTIQNCQRCCVCHYKTKKDRKGPCACICKCYGFFKYSDWGINYNDLPQFGPGDITILYRDRIRVFYSRVHQAQADGYSDYKQLNFSNKNGFLYSFTGLRGDAKRLYKGIMNGSEKRVQLIKAATPVEQARHLEGADLVIWACGYQTNKIPIKDIDNKFVQMSAKVPFTQYDVDQRCRIITSDNGLLMKTFGSGLAYPVRTNDGMILPESGKFNPRADSFSLYMNYVANTLLSNLLPKTRLQNKNHRTVRLGTKKTIAAQALQNGLAPAQNTGGQRAALPTAATNGWVRSGSEVTPVLRSNTLSRPNQIKQNNANGAGGQGTTVNISKVQASPVKTHQPSKANNSSSAQKHPQTNGANNAASPGVPQGGVPVTKQNSQALPSGSGGGLGGHAGSIGVNASTAECTAASGVGEDGNFQVPGYLQSNYITQQRKNAQEQANSPAPKKRNWVPSSQYAGPPINKIPKDTVKALELRMAAENQKQNTLDSTIPTEVCKLNGTVTMATKAPTYIQMHLSESGKAFQAASQSFTMLQPGAAANQTQNRYTLKTTEFQGKFPGEILSNQMQQHHQQQQMLMQAASINGAPEFIKNFSAAQQSYGMQQVQANGTTIVHDTTSQNHHRVSAATAAGHNSMTAYSTPQKHGSSKAAASGTIAGSPLVYSQQASHMVENTPQVHKRKTSFKMAKSSTSKQEDFGSFTASVLVDRRYSPVKQPKEVVHVVPAKELGSNVKSLEATPSTSVSQVGAGGSNLHNLLGSQPNVKQIISNQQPQQQNNQQLQSIQQPITEHQQQAHHVVKSTSSNAYKRHPATAAHHNQTASNAGSKKKSASKHHGSNAVRNGSQVTAGSNLISGHAAIVTGNSSQSTQNTTVMSNQKSSPNIHNSKQSSNSKRAGTFLKNCKTKFQAGSAMPVEQMKQNNNIGQNPTSPEKNLSHLASAGQRQIFNSDESGSVSSANRPKVNQLQEKSAEMGGRTAMAMASDLINQGTASQMHQQIANSSNLNSQTPKNLKHGLHDANIKTVQSSQSNKRRTTLKDQQPQPLLQQRVATNASGIVPLNGNFVANENNQQQLLQQQSHCTAMGLHPTSPSALKQNKPSDLQNRVTTSTPLEEQMRILQQQKQDFQDFNDRDLSAQEVGAGSTSPYPSSQHVREQSRMTEDNFNLMGGLPQDSNNKMRELTLPVNKTSGFAVTTTAGGAQSNTGFAIGGPAASVAHETSHTRLQMMEQQLSPTYANSQQNRRSGSRQKSASRTHRSLSKSKAQQQSDEKPQQVAARQSNDNNYIGVPTTAQQMPAAQVQAGSFQPTSFTAQNPHLDTQSREKAFDNNGLFNLNGSDRVAHPHAQTSVGTTTNATASATIGANQQQQQLLFQKQTSSPPQNSALHNSYMMGQSRKSASSYDVQGRCLTNTMSQPSTGVVPVKIFQLPVQKVGSAGSQASKNQQQTSAAIQTHYMQQILQPSGGTQPNYMSVGQQQTAQQIQQAFIASQMLGSPQPGAGNNSSSSAHKKNNLSQPQQQVLTHFSNGDRMQTKNVKLVHQKPVGSIVHQQTRNPGSPPQTVSIDPATASTLKQNNQAQIAQYGLMHVAGGVQKSRGSTVGNNLPAYQGRAQQLVHAATQSQQAVVVRKPVASQITVSQQQQQPQPPQQYQHSAVVKTTQPTSAKPVSFSPLKLQQHQKAQIMSYSHSQQIPPGSSGGGSGTNHNGAGGKTSPNPMQQLVPPQQQIVNLGVMNNQGHPRQQFMEISSPVTLNSKAKKAALDIQKPARV